MKRDLWLLFGLLLIAAVGLASNTTAPMTGYLVPGSANVTISGGVSSPTSISVTAITQDNSTTVIGLTNANSPLTFPFMGYTYVARFVIISEAWTGFTNGVIHWRGDGSNPGKACVSPREFWFQTNWNWAYSAINLGRIVWSNDVGILNEGTVVIDAELISAQYTNSMVNQRGIAGTGAVYYEGVMNVSNGLTSIEANWTPTTPNSPLDCRLLLETNADGSIIIQATNDSGIESGYSGAFAEYLIVHCRELTTGTNWPFH